MAFIFDRSFVFLPLVFSFLLLSVPLSADDRKDGAGNAAIDAGKGATDAAEKAKKWQDVADKAKKKQDEAEAAKKTQEAQNWDKEKKAAEVMSKIYETQQKALEANIPQQIKAANAATEQAEAFGKFMETGKIPLKDPTGNQFNVNVPEGQRAAYSQMPSDVLKDTTFGEQNLPYNGNFNGAASWGDPKSGQVVTYRDPAPSDGIAGTVGTESTAPAPTQQATYQPAQPTQAYRPPQLAQSSSNPYSSPQAYAQYKASLAAGNGVNDPYAVHNVMPANPWGLSEGAGVSGAQGGAVPTCFFTGQCMADASAIGPNGTVRVRLFNGGAYTGASY